MKRKVPGILVLVVVLASLLGAALPASPVIAAPGPGGTISGTICGMSPVQPQPQPLSGASVKLWDAETYLFVKDTTTAADGSYSFSGLTDGSYLVMAVKPGNSQMFYPGSLSIFQGTPVSVTSNAGASAININLPPGAFIGGRVTTGSASPTPVSDILVLVKGPVSPFPGPGNTVQSIPLPTDSEGYWGSYLPYGDYSIAAPAWLIDPDFQYLQQYYCEAPNDYTVTINAITSRNDINFSLEPAPSQQTSVDFETSDIYTVQGDSFTGGSVPVQAQEFWSFGFKGATQPVNGLTLDLEGWTFDWTKPDHEAGTSYHWDFGNLPADRGVRVYAGLNDSPVSVTTGFNAIRAYSGGETLFTSSGDHELVVTVTPTENFNSLDLNINSWNNNLVNPTITAWNPPQTGSGSLSPDGRNLKIHLDNTSVGVQYVFNVTLHIELLPGVSQVQYMPDILITRYDISEGSGYFTGPSASVSNDQKSWSWHLALAPNEDCLWFWHEALVKGIDFPSYAWAGSCTISGHVYDNSAVPVPVAGASVRAYGYDNKQDFPEALTAADGSYTIQGLPAGDYRVEAWAPGYARQFFENQTDYEYASKVTITGTADPTDIDFHLPPGGSISGTITDSLNNPLENISVECCLKDQKGAGGTITDSSGYYVINGLPFGEYVVRAPASGRWGANDGIYAFQSQTVTVAAGLNPTADFSLLPGGSISGTVTGPLGPVADCHVFVSDYYSDEWIAGTNTGEDGVYTLTGLPTGTYRLQAMPSNNGLLFADEYYDNAYNYSKAVPIVVTAPGAVTGKDFLLTPLPADPNIVEVAVNANYSFNTSEDSVSTASIDGNLSFNAWILNRFDAGHMMVDNPRVSFTTARSLDLTRTNPPPLTTASPYIWTLPDLAVNDNASINTQTTGETGFDPGFSVIRTVTPSELAYPGGDQTINLQVTPREAVDELNISLNVGDLSIPAEITSPVDGSAPGVTVSPDKHQLNIRVENPEIKAYTFSITIHLVVPVYASSVQFKPGIHIEAYNKDVTLVTGTTFTVGTSPDTWEWQAVSGAANNYVWYVSQGLSKQINLDQMFSLIPRSGGYGETGYLVKEWSYEFPGDIPNRMNYGSSPAIADLGPDVNEYGQEPDADLEIVTGSDECGGSGPGVGPGFWRAFDSQGNIEWTTDTLSDQARTSPVIADLNNDGKPEIAGNTTSGNTVEIMDRFGKFVWTFPDPPSQGDLEWPSSPAAADLISTISGQEVIAMHKSTGIVYCFDGDNSDGVNDGISVSGWGGVEGTDWDVIWTASIGGVNDSNQMSTPAIGDVDHDGDLEVVIGSADCKVYILNGQTGAVEAVFTTSGKVPASAALVDLDADSYLEIIIGSNDGYIYCLQWNGTAVALEWSFDTGSPVYSSAAVGDIDSDSSLEIVVGSNNGIVYCLKSDGSLQWSYTTGGPVYSSPALIDWFDVGAYDKDWPMFRHDQYRTGFYGPTQTNLDILVGSSDGYLYLLKGDADSASGEMLDRFLTNGPVHVSPSVADVDGDNLLEAFFYDWLGYQNQYADTFWAVQINKTPISLGSISGTVLDFSSHQAITGATVTAVSQTDPALSYTAYPDISSGSYILAGLMPGGYKVYAQAPGHATRYWDAWNPGDAAVVVIGDTLVHDNVNFNLVAGNIISGRVTSGGNGVKDVSVLITNSTDPNDYRVAFTDINGNYSYAVPLGSYLIKAPSGLTQPGGLPLGSSDSAFSPVYYNQKASVNEADLVAVGSAAGAFNIDFNLVSARTDLRFSTSHNYSVPGDYFLNSLVTGHNSWSTNLHTEGLDLTGVGLSVAPTLPLDSLWPDGYTSTASGYHWNIGTVSAGSGFAAGAANFQSPASFTPGYDASRSVDHTVFTEDGNQTVTVKVTPRAPLEGLVISLKTCNEPFVSSNIISPVSDSENGIKLSEDGKNLFIKLGDPVVGQTYTFTIVVAVDITLGEHDAAVSCLPWVDISTYESGAEGSFTGDTFTHSIPGLGYWIWKTSNSVNWAWHEELTEVLNFQGYATTSVVVTVNSRAFVSPGSDFSVPVEISEVSDFDASTFEITFDPSVLELVRVSQGLIGSTEIPLDLLHEISPGHYSVIVNINDIQPPLVGATGRGTLAVLHFHVKDVSMGSVSPILISGGTLSSVGAFEIPALWISDSVVVDILRGDADNDGRLTSADITMIERIVAYLDSPTPGADANNDGSINAVDITKTERLVAHLD